jgi:hypothetical protein
MKRWIRASCPAQRASSKKRGFYRGVHSLEAPPPAAAGHIRSACCALVPVQGCFMLRDVPEAHGNQLGACRTCELLLRKLIPQRLAQNLPNIGLR